MRRILFCTAALLITAAFSITVQGQGSTLTAITAGAKIITPISLTAGATALHFGTMSVTATAGTCILATDASRTSTGGVNISAGPVVATNALFNVAGEPNAAYLITFPSGPTITVSNALSNTMTISTLTVQCSSKTVNGTTGALSTLGADNFAIGGTLHVNASQPDGNYTGVFNVNVDYN
ncbi:MAG: DUF4402 domain-containing protein [Mariniphaga sp.]